MPYIYLLQCRDDSFYVGSTWDLARRLEEHMTGLGSRHTAKRLPVELVYAEEYERIDDAYDRERQVHGWSRSKKSALALSRHDQLPTLARKIFRWPPFDTPPPAALRACEEIHRSPFETPIPWAGTKGAPPSILCQSGPQDERKMNRLIISQALRERPYDDNDFTDNTGS